MSISTIARLRRLVLPSVIYGLATCSSVVNAAGDDELNNTLQFSSVFFSDPPQIGEDRPQISKLSLENEVFLDLADRFNLTIRPHILYEHLSDDNLKMDLREFLFRYSGDRWEFQAGIAEEFWGVVETRQLVDIINQSDFSADFSGDAKLGQPLVQLTGFSDYGDFSVYYLPVFREPAYASSDSRPRLPFSINESLSTYESNKGDENPDFAFRWSGSFDIWDIGLHYFNGTQRRPLLVATDTGVSSRFRLIEQFGIDAQITVDALLAKFEIIQQSGAEIDNHVEVVAGIEYTFSQVFNSQADLGVLAEALYDSRDDEADHLFQNDLMTGLRIAVNDTNDTQILLTLISDLKNSGKVIEVGFDRRIGPNFTVGLEGRWWRDTDDDATLRTLSTEDHAVFRINWFF